MTAVATKMPDSISATPQTKSWLLKIFKFCADGIPIKKQTPTIQPTAVARLTPKSMRFRTANSNMEINEENPAKLNPRKKRMANGLPRGIFANSWGIQIKVNPVAAGPDDFITSKISDFAIPISFPKIEKTVLKIIMAAMSETRLFPMATVKAFLMTPYRFLT